VAQPEPRAGQRPMRLRIPGRTPSQHHRSNSRAPTTTISDTPPAQAARSVSTSIPAIRNWHLPSGAVDSQSPEDCPQADIKMSARDLNRRDRGLKQVRFVTARSPASRAYSDESVRSATQEGQS
jgi:hypothetical protein